jgi:hypothetical protein
MNGSLAAPGAGAFAPAVSAGPEAVRWVDAFPWIDDVCQGRVTGPRVADRAAQLMNWWAERPAEDAESARLERVAFLADIAIEFMPDWPLGRVVPGLPGTASVDHMGMNTRARNALFRATYETAADLALVTIQQLLDLLNFGRDTVGVAVRGLIGTAALAPPAFGMRPPAWEAEAISDLRTLCGWYASQGLLDRRLLASPVPEGSPPGIQAAWQRLMSLTAASTVPVKVIASRAEAQAADDEPDLVGRAEQAITALSPRRAQIATLNLFADGPPTNDETAAVLGLTRGRIGQLLVATRDEIVAHMDHDGLFSTVADQVRRRIGIALPRSELFKSFPLLAREVPAAGQPLWRVLSRLGGGFEADGDWFTCPAPEEARAATRAVVTEQADAHGVVPLSDLGPLGRFPEWLDSCGLVIYQRWIFTKTGGIGDWTAALLAAGGTPLTDQEIHATLPGRTLKSVQNALRPDPRVHRSDVGTWALAEWGMPLYDGIRALIRDELARNGGQLPLNDLVTRITGRCKAAPRSVALYARQAPFRVDGGIVSLAPASVSGPAALRLCEGFRRAADAEERFWWRVRQDWELSVSADESRQGRIGDVQSGNIRTEFEGIQSLNKLKGCVARRPRPLPAQRRVPARRRRPHPARPRRHRASPASHRRIADRRLPVAPSTGRTGRHLAERLRARSSSDHRRLSPSVTG